MINFSVSKSLWRTAILSNLTEMSSKKFTMRLTFLGSCTLQGATCLCSPCERIRTRRHLSLGQWVGVIAAAAVLAALTMTGEAITLKIILVRSQLLRVKRFEVVSMLMYCVGPGELFQPHRLSAM